MHYLKNNFFKIKSNSTGLTSIVNPNDPHKMDFLLQDENTYFDFKTVFKELGFFIIRYDIDKSDQVFEADPNSKENKTGPNKNNYNFFSKDNNLEINQDFQLHEKTLEWKIRLTNISNFSIEINDLELPLSFNTAYASSWQETYLRRAVRHSFIAGAGSFIFLTKAGGDPPFLLMSPKPGTSIDCFDINKTNDAGRFEGAYSIFLHAAQKIKIRNGDYQHFQKY